MRRELTPAELDTLYREIGQGVWHLQYVEDALNTFITLRIEVKKPGALSEGAAVEKLAKYRNNTFGTSLRIARENGILSPELEVRLSHFNGERNWLVHRSLNTYGEQLYTDEGRAETFRRLRDFFEEAKQLQHAIADEIVSFAKSHHINISAVEQQAHAQVAKLKGLT